MESNPSRLGLSFADLRQRLLGVVNRRINNGEFSERGLARMVGISQPQMHNLLKGARKLTSETADLLLETLKISLPELLSAKEVHSAGNLELFPQTLAEELKRQLAEVRQVSYGSVRKGAASAAAGRKSIAS